MKSYINGFILNLQFFSTIPVKKEIPLTNEYIERAIQTFPLLGILQGLMYATLCYMLLMVTNLSPLAVAFFLWLFMIILTGGIHLDGWMDTSDAYFSFRQPKERLDIMSDPRIGAFGVLSVIILLIAKMLFFYEIILRLQTMTYVLIVMVPFFGKTFMGWILCLTPLAKDRGMGYFFQRATKRGTLFIYFFYIILSFLVVWVWKRHLFLFIMVIGVITSLIFIYVRKKVIHWFGGITGDVAGASVEGVESCLWMAVWLYHYIGTG